MLELSRVVPICFTVTQNNLSRVKALQVANNGVNRSRVLNLAIAIGLEQLETADNKKPAVN